MCIADRLNRIAYTLLDKNIGVWQQAVRMWQEEPHSFVHSGLSDRYDMDDDCLTETADSGCLIHLFLGVARDMGYTCYMDWAGESKKELLEGWADSRLRKLGHVLNYQEIHSGLACLDTGDLARGEFILHKFDVVSQFLKKNGFTMLFFQDGSDAYYPFILRSTDWDKKRKNISQKSDGYPYPILTTYDQL